MTKQVLGLKIPFRLGENGYFDANMTTIGQVVSNIKNLLLTKPGERRFNNEFGSGLYNILFEQNDIEASRDMLVEVVQNDLDKYLNGVIVNNVNVGLSADQPLNADKNKIFISVDFTYNNISTTTEVEINNN